MRLVLFLVLRAWRGNPWRTGLTVLGIALGIAVVTAIHVMDHNTIQSRLRARSAETGRVDFELDPREPGRDLGELQDVLAAAPGVGAVGAVWRAPVEIPVGDAAVPVRTVVYGVAPFPDEGFAQYAVQRGAEPAADDPDGVLVGAAWLAELGVDVGARLELRAAAQTARPRCIGGVLQGGEARPRARSEPIAVVVRGVLADQRLGSRERGFAIVAGLDLARRLAARAVPLLQVTRAYGADVDALRTELEREFVVRDERSALMGESSDERAFRNGVKLLGGLALMLGMFVVFQTLSQSLVERLRQIGLLRCLGTSSTTISLVFLLDGVAMAVAGAVLGVGLGLLLAMLLQQMQFSTLGMLKPWQLDEVPLAPLLWTAGLGVVFTLAGAAFPLWRAWRLPVIRILHARGLSRAADVLKGVNLFLFGLLVVVLPIGYLAMTTILSETERETRLVLLELGGLLLVFGGVLLLAPQIVRTLGALLVLPLRSALRLPVHLVHKALRRQTGRFAASVCGLGVVLLAVIALESLTSALHGDARRFGRTAMPDALFMGGEPVSVDEARALVELPGVAAVDPLVGPVAAPFQVSGLEPTRVAALLGADFDAEDQRRFADQRTLIVSGRLARLQGLAPGQAVPLLTDGGPVAYTVLAVDDRAGFFPDDPAWAIAHPRWLRQDFCVGDEQVHRLVLRLAPGVAAGAVRRAVRERLPQLDFAKSGDAIVDYLVRDVTRDFKLFQVLLVLILGLAGLGVVNAMTIAALGRAREIGVLRALGASRRQLRIAFLLEGALTGVLAAGVALALGIPLGRIVVRGMNDVAGLDAPYLVPTHVLWLVPVGAVAVGVLASLVPGARAARMSPARAVRFE
ncbi:MAG: FtsX-like permease family protein [Planctomycetes bacterium]|nr:FtsX-like permease family protein [Planctomycetota bacterium]